MNDEHHDIHPREEARIRRRDRDAEAPGRALLRPGMGKVFKQIQDAQRRIAGDLRSGDAAPGEERRSGRRGTDRRSSR